MSDQRIVSHVLPNKRSVDTALIVLQEWREAIQTTAVFHYSLFIERLNSQRFLKLRDDRDGHW